MFCMKCGTQVAEGAMFCHSCGASIGNAVDGRANNNGAAVNESSRAYDTYESLTLSVHPYDEQATIEIYQIFGWELVSTQTVDTTKASVNYEEKLVLEDKNYVKLCFRRNKNIQRYEDLVKLQKKYEENDERETKDTSHMYIVIGIIIIFAGSFIPSFAIQSILQLACIGGMVYIGVNKKNWNKKVDERNEERLETQRACISLAKDIRGL